MTDTNETQNNIVHAEPHDVRMARKILAVPPRDPKAEISMERMLAGAVVRYYEKSRP